MTIEQEQALVAENARLLTELGKWESKHWPFNLVAEMAVKEEAKWKHEIDRLNNDIKKLQYELNKMDAHARQAWAQLNILFDD